MYRLLPDDLPNHDRVPRVLTRADALALGFTRHAIAHRLATDRWHLVLPHTYLTGSTLTWPDRVNAALAFAGPDALLTGAAALADLGLRTVRRPDRLLLLVPRSNHMRPAGWVRLRRTDRMPPPALVPGPRRADLARSVADLALERRNLDDVRALVTQSLRARLCTLPELWAELESGPHKFSANLRRALQDADAGAWSAPEARAAAILCSAEVPPFEQNACIDLPDGSQLYVDFLWRALRAVLEIDSDEHHGDPAERDDTDRRHLQLETLGFSVAHRRPNVIIREPRRFRREMESWLAARAVELAA
jgi:very-short-patch-repair endonuclease